MTDLNITILEILEALKSLFVKNLISISVIAEEEGICLLQIVIKNSRGDILITLFVVIMDGKVIGIFNNLTEAQQKLKKLLQKKRERLHHPLPTEPKN